MTSATFHQIPGSSTLLFANGFTIFTLSLVQMAYLINYCILDQVIKQSLATHTSIAELIKERTDNPQFLEFLQAEQEIVNYQVGVILGQPLALVEQCRQRQPTFLGQLFLQ